MRIFHWASIIIVVYAGLPSAPVFAAVGQFQNTRGDVKTSLGKGVATQANDGTPLENNMTVTTGPDSHAVLKFDDRQIVVLQSNSVFRIRNYHYDTRKPRNSDIFFEMLKGGLRAITGLIGAQRHEAFRLSTPATTVGIRGTDFMTVIQQKTDVLYSHVNTGAVSLTNQAGTAVVNAAQNAMVASATSLPVTINAAAVPAGIFTELNAIPVSPSIAATTTALGEGEEPHMTYPVPKSVAAGAASGSISGRTISYIVGGVVVIVAATHKGTSGT